MRKMTFALLTVIVGAIVLTPALGWVKNEDINRDGVKEKIEYNEKIEVEEFKCPLKVVRQGKIIFQTALGPVEDFRIIDIDQRFHGREIVVIRPANLGLVGNDVCIDTCVYLSDIYRWDKSGKYVYFWETRTPFHNRRNLDEVIRDIKAERPRFMKAQKTAQGFVRAIADGKWAKVQSMMQKDKPWIKVSDYHGIQKDCQHFPSPKTWEMFASPHEKNNICFIVRKSKTQAFTIIVTPQGVEMGRGDCWD